MMASFVRFWVKKVAFLVLLSYEKSLVPSGSQQWCLVDQMPITGAVCRTTTHAGTWKETRIGGAWGPEESVEAGG